MNIRQITVGSFQANCFVIWDRSDQAIIVDPGDDARAILAVLEQNNLAAASYMLTHGHVDHISALAELCRAMPAPVGLSATDLEWAFDKAAGMPPFYPPPESPPEIARLLQDGQTWTDGGLTYAILSTPGHTPGCVCLLFPEQKALFTGDTLFAGSVGRTDLYGGNSRALAESLKKLAALPHDTEVYCGHGPKTTIGREKAHNFFLAGL